MPAPDVKNGLYHATVMDTGRIVIPAALRRALHLEKGSRVALRLAGDRIEILSQTDLIAQLQTIAKKHPGKGGRLASVELITERRKAAARGD